VEDGVAILWGDESTRTSRLKKEIDLRDSKV